MHGTVRDREKTMRGLKEDDTPLVDGHEIYYNFIKPHEALIGLTPAEAAGLCLDIGEDRWLGLLKKSLQHSLGN